MLSAQPRGFLPCEMRVLDTALVSNSTKDCSRKKDIGGKMAGKATTQAVCMGRSSPGPQQGTAFANKSTKKVQSFTGVWTHKNPFHFVFQTRGRTQRSSPRASEPLNPASHADRLHPGGSNWGVPDSCCLLSPLPMVLNIQP